MLLLQDQVVACNAVLMIITLWAVINRLSLRLMLTRSWKGHDVLITIAAVFALMMSIISCVGTRYGLGQHVQDISLMDIISLQKVLVAVQVVYFLCNMFVKHAILAFCSDMMASTIKPAARYCIYNMHVVSFLFGISSVIVILTQCTPFAAIIDPRVPGRCINVLAFNYANGSIMLATDIILYILPLVLTWNLQLRSAQAIALRCLFALGFLVLIASAIRLVVIHHYAQVGDATYNYARAIICSAVENHIAIWVACAPSIKTVSKVLFVKIDTAYSTLKSRVVKTRQHSRSGSAGIANMFKASDAPSNDDTTGQKDHQTEKSAGVPQIHLDIEAMAGLSSSQNSTPPLPPPKDSPRPCTPHSLTQTFPSFTSRLISLLPLRRNRHVTELHFHSPSSSPSPTGCCPRSAPVRPPRPSFNASRHPHRITVTTTTEVEIERIPVAIDRTRCGSLGICIAEHEGRRKDDVQARTEGVEEDEKEKNKMSVSVYSRRTSSDSDDTLGGSLFEDLRAF